AWAPVPLLACPAVLLLLTLGSAFRRRGPRIPSPTSSLRQIECCASLARPRRDPSWPRPAEFAARLRLRLPAPVLAPARSGQSPAQNGPPRAPDRPANDERQPPVACRRTERSPAR